MASGDDAVAYLGVPREVEIELESEDEQVAVLGEALSPDGRDGVEVDVVEGLGSLVVEELAEGVERPVVEPIVHRQEQVFLVGEVLVDRAPGEAGRFGDLVERRPVEAAPGEHDLGGVEQGVAGVLAASLRGPLLNSHPPILPPRGRA